MSETNQPQRPERSPAEWVSFAIACFILATLIGLVSYQWLTKKDRPPVLSLTQNASVRFAEGQFYVPFAVTNTGGETAEFVQVVAELRVNGQLEEAGEQQIDFLSSGESQKGAFVFSRNPQDGQLILRVASYKLP